MDQQSIAWATFHILLDAKLALCNDPEWGHNSELSRAHVFIDRVISHLGIRAEYKTSTTESFYADTSVVEDLSCPF